MGVSVRICSVHIRALKGPGKGGPPLKKRLQQPRVLSFSPFLSSLCFIFHTLFSLSFFSLYLFLALFSFSFSPSLHLSFSFSLSLSFLPRSLSLSLSLSHLFLSNTPSVPTHYLFRHVACSNTRSFLAQIMFRRIICFEIHSGSTHNLSCHICFYTQSVSLFRCRRHSLLSLALSLPCSLFHYSRLFLSRSLSLSLSLFLSLPFLSLFSMFISLSLPPLSLSLSLSLSF